MEHVYKCWPEHFKATLKGVKSYDVRRDDRDVRPSAGDFVRLDEWDPFSRLYSGASAFYRVQHVLVGDDSLLPFGWFVMGLTPANAADFAESEDPE